MPKLTPEQQQESEARIEAFRKEYIELTKKYQVDFCSIPEYVQIHQGVFATVMATDIVDRKYTLIPSDLGNQIIKEL